MIIKYIILTPYYELYFRYWQYLKYKVYAEFMWGGHDRSKIYNKSIQEWDANWYDFAVYWYDNELYTVGSNFVHITISSFLICYYIYFIPTNKFYHFDMQMVFYTFSFLLSFKIYHFINWYFTCHLLVVPLIYIPWLCAYSTHQFIVFYPKFFENVKDLDTWSKRVEHDNKIMEQKLYRSHQRRRRHKSLGNRFYNFIILPNESHYDAWVAERYDLNDLYAPPKDFEIDPDFNKDDYIVSKKERRHKFNAEWLWRHRPKPVFEAPDNTMYEYLENKGFNSIYQEPIFSHPKMSEAWLLRLAEIKKAEEELTNEEKIKKFQQSRRDRKEKDKKITQTELKK